MGNVSRVLMQHGHRGHELTDDAERGVRVDVDGVLFRGRQHLRQPSTCRVLRDDAEYGSAFETIDAPYARVGAVTEVGKAIDPFAERELECGNCNELRRQAKDAELVAPFFQRGARGRRDHRRNPPRVAREAWSARVS